MTALAGDTVDRLMQIGEVWRTAQHEGRRYTEFEVSATGLVRESVSRRLVPTTEPRPYSYPVAFERLVDLGDRTVALAEVVLESFGDRPPYGFMVAHRDGNPRNCRLENLDWVYPGRVIEGYVEPSEEGFAPTDAEYRAVHVHRALGTPPRLLVQWFGLARSGIVADIVNGRQGAHTHPSVDRETALLISDAREVVAWL